MKQLLSTLRVEYPDIRFVQGAQFSWSPATRTITYPKPKKASDSLYWSLLHELGHAVLDHKAYDSDVELLKMESEAWQTAQQLGAKYGYKIDDDHVQDCIDTYRDWLHQRSACPTCENRSLQQDIQTYRCFNCDETWTVTSAKFCRPYRRKLSQDKTSPPHSKVMFS